MKHFAIVVALFMVACGPRVRDKDKSGPVNNSSANGTPNGSTNGTPNGTDNGSTNVALNNVSPNNTNSNNVAPNNTNPNNTNPNNTNPNNTNPNNTNPNNTTNNNTVPPGVAQKCATACELLWGNCVDTRCGLDAQVQQALDELEAGCKGTGGDPAELCTDRYQTEPNYKSIVDEIVTDGTCTGEFLTESRCFTFGTDVCTGCPTPDLGGPCTSDGQCDGGLLSGYCIAQDTDGSYPGGQCLAGGCDFGDSTEGSFVAGGGTGCGDDGACYVIDATSSACLPTCLTNNDCDRGVTGPNQSGYSCLIVGTLVDSNGQREALGICQTACSDALPCEAGFVCGNTQACEYECTTNADCPQDFNCTGVTDGDMMYCEYAG